MDDKEKAVFFKSRNFSDWNSKKLFYHFMRINRRKWIVKRAEVYYVDFGENIGSEQNKARPCVVIQSDAYNFSAATFICAVISDSGKIIPDIHIPITGVYHFLDEQKNKKQLAGAIDLGHIRTIAKERILFKICDLKDEVDEINAKLPNIFGLSGIIKKMENEIASLKGKVEYLKTSKNNS